MKETLFYSGEGRKEFWSISTERSCYTIVCGEVGTEGEKSMRFFDTEEKAEAAAQRQLKIKLNKGYHREGEEPVVKKAKAKPGSGAGGKKAAATPADPLAPVEDDGKRRAWQDAELEDYFTPEALANPVEPDRQPPAPAGEPGDGDDWDEDEDDWDDAEPFNANNFARDCRKLPPAEVQKTWERAVASGTDQTTLQKGLNNALEGILTSALQENGLLNLPWLLEQGATPPDTGELDSPWAICFGQAYAAGQNPRKAAESLNAFLNKTFDELAQRLADGLAQVAKAVETGKYDEAGGVVRLPTAEEMEWVAQLRLGNIDEVYFVTIETANDANNTLFKGIFDANQRIHSSVTALFLPDKLRPLLEKMDADGIFDKLPAPALTITECSTKEVLLRKVLNKELLAQKQQEDEALVQRLEATTNFKEDSPLLEEALAYLLDDLIVQDLPRASALIGRFLYSLDESAEEMAAKMLGRYEWQHPRLQSERAQWLQANGHYPQAINVMRFALKAGFSPAEEKLREYEELARQRKLERDQPAEPRQSGSGKVRFQDFAQQDLFCDTDHILARAYESGAIRIRFKIEGEQGYGEALDFVNNLLEKGYSRLHRGYMLQVRFLAKPQYIPHLPKFPKTSCHAFFAKAVQYPALREQVRRYAELALKKYDWYRDLDEENGTVPGTFAACALAFCDEDYIHMAGQYARKSDNEHQYIHLQLAPALLKAYGPVPEVAKAVFDICAANGQGQNIGRMPAELYTDPANLRAVMEHIESGVYPQQQLTWYVARCVGDMIGGEPSGNLRKLKALWQGARGDDQMVYEDFYNLYKGYATLKYKEDYGEDLASTPVSVKVTLPTYHEDPPVVRSLKDFKKQFPDREIGDVYPAERLTLLFIPQVIDNPYLLDYAFDQWDALDTIAGRAAISLGWVTSAMQMGDWVVDLDGPAKEFGVVLYSGKAKPIILYGVLNTVTLFARQHKRPYKTAEEAELARLANLLEEAADYRRPSPAEKVNYDRCDAACSALFDERHYAAGKLLETFVPEDGRVYDAALLLRAKLAKKMVQPAEERAVYEELAARRPEYADYWREKLG